jgi:hypothetical protein
VERTLESVGKILKSAGSSKASQRQRERQMRNSKETERIENGKITKRTFS